MGCTRYEIELMPLGAVAVAAKATAIFDVPSKLVPPIVLAVSSAVAVAAFPVQFNKFPVKEVAAKAPVLALKVKFVPDLGGRFPVAAVANSGKQVVSEDSSATVTLVAIEAVPVKSATKALADLSHNPFELSPVKVTSPLIVSPVKVPREVKELVTTLDAIVVPVKLAA